MDIVKIGFQINAAGIKDANTQIEKLLDKADNLTKKKITLNFVLGSSYKNIQKTFTELEKRKRDFTALQLNLSMVGYVNIKKSLDNLIAIKDKLKDVQVKVSTSVAPLTALMQQLSKLKNQILTVSINASTKQITQLRQQLALIRDKVVTIKTVVNGKAVSDLLSNMKKFPSQKTIKIDVKVTPSLQVLRSYNTELTTLLSTMNSLSRVTVPRMSIGGGSRESGGILDTLKNIGKFAILSTVVYAALNAVRALSAAMVTLADEYTATQNRLKLYIKDAETLAGVNTFLAKSAIQNNIGLRESAALYAKLAPSMQRIGANTAATKQVVDAFGKSLRIGGATLREAEAATVQFAQAMASGKLAGDEFRSISEASPRFLKAIADGSGIAAEKLKEMSAAGMLTTEVISRALIKEYSNLTKESKELGYTLEQGANALKVGFMALVGEFNEGAGITQYLGTALAALGVNMIDGAEGAKKSGEEFRKWASTIKDELSVALDVLKVALIGVSSVLVARMIAAMGKYIATTSVAIAQTIALRVSLIAASAAAASTTGTVTTLTVATRVLGATMGTVKTALGGWVGVALTVAGVAASYLMMRDSAVDANQALVEQNKYVSMTTEELLKLDAAQRKTAKFKIEIDLIEANKNIEKAKEDYEALLDSFSFKAKNRINMFDPNFLKQLEDIKTNLADGTFTFDQATEKLVALGAVSESDAIAFNKMSEEFNKTVGAGTSLARVAKDLGVKVNLTNTAAQGGVSVQKLLQDELKRTGDQAIITGSKLNKLAEDFKKTAVENRATLAIMRSTGLDEGNARKVAEAVAAKREQLKTVLLPQGTKGLDDTWMVKVEIEGAKEAQASAKEISDYQDKLAEQQKKLKETNPFPEQLVELNRMVALMKQGVDADVAKIASQKEYVKWYGTNISYAKQLVALEKQRKDIEDAVQEARKRHDSESDLRKQISSYTEIGKLMREGFSLDIARKAVSDGFMSNNRGLIYASNLLTSSLKEQNASLTEQVTTQEDLYDFVKKGMSIEEASLYLSIYRNKQLKVGQESLVRALVTTQKDLQFAQSRVEISKDLNQLAEQAFTYAVLRNNEEAEIAGNYDKITQQAIKEVSVRQKILESVKEYNSYLKDKKEDPFLNVDFSVFGDFGNPFQSALDGLTSMLSGVDTLKTKYTEMYAELDKQVINAAGKQADLDKISITRQALRSKELVEQQNLRDSQIASSLKATKMLFKEESKGYKAVTVLEQLLQAKKIAFALWEKRESIQAFAIKAVGYAKEVGMFLASVATKIAAQAGLNAVSGIGAILSAAQQPGPAAFVGFAAMAALVAGLGVAVASTGGSQGSFAPTNNGTGTVFGDANAQSESIKKSIDLLAENSDVTLPLTSAMLRSLQNIENNIGGLANLLIRSGAGTSLASGITEGFTSDMFGNILEKAGNTFFAGIGDFLGINRMIGGFLGGLFGSKTTIKGQGLFAGSQALSDILSGGISLQEYVDVNTKKKTLGVTTSNKNSTIYSQASAELSNQFSLIFKNFYSSILNTVPLLDKNLNEVTSQLDKFVVSIGRIDLQGLNGEQIQEKLNAVLGAEADKMAQAAITGLEDFQKVGEGYFETIMRVASSVELAKVYTDRLGVSTVKYTDVLNKQGDVATEIIRQSVLLNESTKGIANGFYDLVNNFNGTAGEITDFVLKLRDLQDAIAATGKSGDYLTSAMFAGAGSLERLSSGLDAYFEMLSPAEQAAELTRRLTNEFAIFGKELPSDVKAFRNLVNSIDITSEAGQKLYGQIIALAPEFNDLQDAIKNANSDVNALVQSLRDLAEQARAARGDTEQPRNLGYVRNQFEVNAALAMQGDKEAANRLLGLGKDLLNLSKIYSITSSEYARDLALIQRAATVAAAIQEKGLGTSQTPDLNLPTTTPVTPTVNTTTSSTDTRLDDLSVKLEAGLFAIAKFVQNLDSRTERWDDGNRVMVGVQLENGDAPIPVVVTT